MKYWQIVTRDTSRKLITALITLTSENIYMSSQIFITFRSTILGESQFDYNNKFEWGHNEKELH